MAGVFPSPPSLTFKRSKFYIERKLMFRNLKIVFIALLLITMAGAQQKANSPQRAKPAATDAKVAGLPSEAAVNGFLQQTFGYNPALTWKIEDIKPSPAQGVAEVTVIITSPEGQQPSTFYVTADGEHALLGEIIPFGVRPFDHAKQTLEKGINGPSRGPADAPVTVVEFSDLQCPHCKEAQPTVDKLLSEDKNARLVFQNFPLPSHDWAAKAAYYADCIGRDSNDAVWKFIQSVYDAQKEISAANADEKLKGLADAAGAKGAEVAVCAAKADTAGRVEHSVALGKSVDVGGTPTLFVNGRKIGNVSGMPYEALKSLVDFAAKDAGAKK
jgi:protein-disulfide isomerase